jgi:uncharacterized protein YggE
MPFRPMLVAILVSAALSPELGRAQAQPPSAAARVLRVSGGGRVAARPDVAVLTAGVESYGTDLGRVTREAAAQMQKVMRALSDTGIAEGDIQTTRHDVEVQRDWRSGHMGRITGYDVSDEVRVTVRDLSRVGPVLDRVAGAGANALRSLSFEKEDSTPEQARALATAYAAARVKAEALAKAAGVTLGELVSASEIAEPRPVAVEYARRASAGASTPVSAGEVQISAAVEVVYAIR